MGRFRLRRLDAAGAVKSAELPRLLNRRVTITGYVADRKKIKTANGKGMVFLSMEDELDMFEVTLFPEVYRRVGERIFRKPILRSRARCSAT